MRASDVQREIDRMAGKYEQDDGALTKDQIDQIRGDPVAVVRWNDIGHISWRTHVMLSDNTPLYTAPPQRTWVGLTDNDWNRSKHNYDFQKGVDWAESILKEKNG